MTTLVMFCEAGADFRTASCLIDRLLREEGPSWIGDHLDTYPADTLRKWLGDAPDTSFIDIHHLTKYASRLNVRSPRGHFGGEPGAAGSLMARTAFLIARQIMKESGSPPVDAVVLVWDMDDQGEARREGLTQARDEALHWSPFRIILGCPDPMREAWVLAGFEAENDDERSRLSDLRRELGFSPCEEAHRLGAKNEQAKKNPKRTLEKLTQGDHEREERCLSMTSLEVLRARGTQSGLATFLDEVKQQLIPLITHKPAIRSGPDQ
jgi:hypothetical protein